MLAVTGDRPVTVFASVEFMLYGPGGLRPESSGSIWAVADDAMAAAATSRETTPETPIAVLMWDDVGWGFWCGDRGAGKHRRNGFGWAAGASSAAKMVMRVVDD
jgi:hypothetical protein